ncbi:FKBP-type peptidyl-prolyl cis-trans isomerase [Bacteroidota bacterium]
MDSVSYSLGVNVAQGVKAQGLEEINVDAVAQGFRDIFTEGATPMVDDMQSRQILTTYFNSLQASRGEKLKKAGEDFLAENKNKPGVTTLSSGLQYEVMVEGTGAKPALTDRVKTHYHGTLIDGTVFDSSVERGEPISFAVNGVIPGWTEALQLMAVGSKWKLFIPYNLAYGERGSGPVIGPFAALIFEVELLDIEK